MAKRNRVSITVNIGSENKEILRAYAEAKGIDMTSAIKQWVETLAEDRDWKTDSHRISELECRVVSLEKQLQEMNYSQPPR